MRTPLAIALWSVAVAAAAAPTDGSLAVPRTISPELDTAIARYRTIEAAGGWPAVPRTPTIHPGDRSPVTPVLRDRLTVSGDLATPPASARPAGGELYAGALVDAVRAFQARHGLAVDGVVGARTVAAMNVPAHDRVAQLELAAERMRRRLPPPARRYIRVNIPAYWLELIEDGRSTLAMPVVVGRPTRATPEMTSAINYLVLNPPWTIPTKLAYEDILPKLQHDPTYLAAHDIRVYAGWRRDAEEIDPNWIDWQLIGAHIKSLKLRQAPGAENPLGRIKFHMANAFDVYLHDTSSHDLMAMTNRALSSGCVRVGDARALADALLASNPDWPAARIDEAIASRETIKVRLRTPVPVQLYYQTAWATADGRVEFRDDIYHADETFAADLTPATQPVTHAPGPAVAERSDRP
jgi:murein L,D-transpeptidase YcbB/YkuD